MQCFNREVNGSVEFTPSLHCNSFPIPFDAVVFQVKTIGWKNHLKSTRESKDHCQIEPFHVIAVQFHFQFYSFIVDIG